LTRVQEMIDDTMAPERIKFKFVYSDYVEVNADNQISDDIRIRIQNQASLVQILSAYFLVEFYICKQTTRKTKFGDIRKVFM
jgi:hypothetical protein